MEPTFQEKDYLVTDKLTYLWEEPSPGDIVIVENENKLIIKRVIGIEGDEIMFIPRDGNQPSQLLRNGVVLQEDYIKEEMVVPEKQTVTVPEDSVYVLGDNRNNSLDSRQQGPFPVEKVEGRVRMELLNDWKTY